MNEFDIDADFGPHYSDAFVMVGNRRIHYTDWNPDGARTLLLVHGLNVQLHTWDPIAKGLMDDFRVICVDLRGHGESDWTIEGYWTGQFVEDLRTVVKHAGVGQFAFVGHSLGARIGFAYAGEHASELTHLLLSDTGPELARTTAQSVGGFVANTNDVRGFRSRDEALEYYRGMHPEWQPVFHHLHARYQVRENWAGKFVLRADPDMYWIMRGAGVKEVPYLWEMAARAAVPTLIMRGARSPFLNDEITDRMVKVMPSAEVETFDTGHYIPREDPTAFVRSVRAAVQR